MPLLPRPCTPKSSTLVTFQLEKDTNIPCRLAEAFGYFVAFHSSLLECRNRPRSRAQPSPLPVQTATHGSLFSVTKPRIVPIARQDHHRLSIGTCSCSLFTPRLSPPISPRPLPLPSSDENTHHRQSCSQEACGRVAASTGPSRSATSRARRARTRSSTPPAD